MNFVFTFSAPCCLRISNIRSCEQCSSSLHSCSAQNMRGEVSILMSFSFASKCLILFSGPVSPMPSSTGILAQFLKSQNFIILSIYSLATKLDPQETLCASFSSSMVNIVILELILEREMLMCFVLRSPRVPINAP